MITCSSYCLIRISNICPVYYCSVCRVGLIRPPSVQYTPPSVSCHRRQNGVDLDEKKIFAAWCCLLWPLHETVFPGATASRAPALITCRCGHRWYSKTPPKTGQSAADSIPWDSRVWRVTDRLTYCHWKGTASVSADWRAVRAGCYTETQLPNKKSILG